MSLNNYNDSLCMRYVVVDIFPLYVNSSRFFSFLMVYLIIILPLFTAVADSLPCVFFLFFFLSLFCAFLRVSSWKNCTHGWVLVNSSPLLACSSLSLDSPSEEKIIKLKYVLTLNINPVKTQLNLTLFCPLLLPILELCTLDLFM